MHYNLIDCMHDFDRIYPGAFFISGTGFHLCEILRTELGALLELRASQEAQVKRKHLHSRFKCSFISLGAKTDCCVISITVG